MKTKLSVILLLAVILAACAPATTPAPTPDTALISTAAAQTVIANFTLTANSWTPTSLPAPTETPTSMSLATATTTTAAATVIVPTQPGLPGATQAALCDRYSWDNATVDVNVPDNTQMTPGQDFVKTWKIKNAGTCTWGAGYTIIYSYGDKMSGVAQPINSVVAPGQEIEISVQFKAPTQIGEYVSAWTLANPKGIPFFGNDNKPLYVKIVVKI